MIASVAYATGISPRELEQLDGDYLEALALILTEQNKAAQR